MFIPIGGFVVARRIERDVIDKVLSGAA